MLRGLMVAGLAASSTLAACSVILDEESTSGATGDASTTIDGASIDSGLCFKEDIGCPPSLAGQEWETHASSCSCYLSTDSFGDASQATEQCTVLSYKGYTSHLLVINDAEERAMMEDRDNLQDKNGDVGDSFLLGLFYDEGVWKWATGEELDTVAVVSVFDSPTNPPEQCVRFARNQGNRWLLQDCAQAGGAETICEMDGQAAVIAPRR